ncbi:MAG: peptidoglycan DD-metalloendopeptidase family protein [Bacteroidales bacterium]|nr:peptidoglycan DD-metalloendopeptidase family protein [Bacteroidales bacterium]
MNCKTHLFFLTITLAFCSALFLNSAVYSQSKERLQQDKRRLEEEIALTNRLLNETKRNTQTSVSQLVLINNQIRQRESLIQNISSEIRQLNNSISANNESIEILKKELTELKEQYSKMIYYAYKNRSAYNRLMFIFSSKDFNQAYKRMKYIQQYSFYRKKQAEMIIEKQAELVIKVNELEQMLNNRRDLLTAQNEEKGKLDREKSDKNRSISELRQREQELNRTIREKQAAAQRLQRAIEAIIAEEIRLASERARRSSGNTEIALTPEEMALSNNFISNKGRLPWPLLRAVVTGAYGENPHPVLPGIKINNRGIDMSTTQGAKARAVFDGTVIRIVEMPMYRNVVIISHGEYFSVYSKLDRVLVRQGERVRVRQDIGLVFTDTEESKTELHFEIWKGNTSVNPVEWLSR